MREWPGLKLNKRPVGDGFTVLDNVELATAGELNRRRGLGTRVALPWTATWVRQHPTIGTAAVAGHVGGLSHLALVDLATGVYSANTALATAADTGALAGVNGAVYWSDGANAMRVFYDGDTTLHTAGIDPPAAASSTTTAAAGSVTSGTHLIRYRYYDATRNRYSDPSPAVSVTIAGHRTATGVVRIDTAMEVDTAEIVDAGDGYYGGYVGCTLAGGGGTGAQVLAFPAYVSSGLPGGIGRLLVSSRGSGYTSAPTLTIPDPPTLSATINADVVASASFGVTAIIVEMTLAEGSEFYQVASVTNTTATQSITMSDDILAVQVASADYTEDGYGHGVPPKGTLIAPHRSRMFCWGATEEASDTLYWSRAGFVESWKPAEWSRRVFGGTADRPRAMFSLSDDLYLVGSRSMARLIFTTDPGMGFVVQLPTTSGAWNQQCIVEAEGAYFGFGNTGIWRVSSLQPEDMSQRIRSYLTENIDTTEGDRSFGWWDPTSRAVTFVFLSLDTKWRGVSYDLDSDTWIQMTFNQRISGATAIAWDDDVVDPFICGESCYYRQNATATDGGPTSLSSTVSTYADPTLTTTGAHGLAVGVWIYFPRANVWGEVTDVPAASTATVAGLVGILPSDAIVHGAIPVTVTSEWHAREGLERGKAAYLRLEAAPTEALGLVYVRFFSDWSNTPLPYSSDADMTPPNGVTYDAVNSRFSVDLDASNGYAKVPIPSDNFRVIRYELSILSTAAGVHLMDAEIEPKAKRGAE